MKLRSRFVILAFAVLLIAASFVLWPGIDLTASGLFYNPQTGFFLRDNPVLLFLHHLSYSAPRLLGGGLIAGLLCAALRRKPFLKLSAKAWLFLILALVIGPGLIANGAFKDHWGRARPREVSEFGGSAQFTAALIPAKQCQHNCSFVSGDGAFGFFLPVFAYITPRRYSRRVFWSGMGFGVLFSFARLATGAHFLSDIFFAALFMQLALLLLHIFMFGYQASFAYWRLWLFAGQTKDY